MTLLRSCFTSKVSFLIEKLHFKMACVTELLASQNCLRHRTACVTELLASQNCLRHRTACGMGSLTLLSSLKAVEICNSAIMRV